MELWLAEMGVPYTHIYVSKQVRGPVELDGLRQELLASPGYTLLLDDAGATVVARTDSPAAERWSEPPIAPDCQTLFDQPQRVQTEFYERHGAQAPWVWAEQHSRELTRRRRW